MIRLAVLLAGACLLAIAAASAGAARPVATVQPIGPALARTMTGVSWKPGCPVGLRDLRVVTARHWGFDGREHTGRIVVHRDVAADVASVLRRLHHARFPIRRMVPVDAYGASDFRSIEADNTSAFNCRYVEGTTRWSNHAFGRAIDVNPIENPYVSGGSTAHAASRPYVDRARRRPGMAFVGGALVRAFDRIGWGWGGRWESSTKDYQHFSETGR